MHFDLYFGLNAAPPESQRVLSCWNSKYAPQKYVNARRSRKSLWESNYCFSWINRTLKIFN